MKKLEVNTKRQAVPTLKGYAYQIWQSVLQWLELEENQYIFLEGAEDIDLLKANSVETIQVKATSLPITLGLKGISDAINNYWEHKSKNPHLKVRFKYLTTSERGQERNDPFDGVKGLDLWDSCKFPDVDISSLRKFLKNSNNFLPALQKFLLEASDEDVRQELIIPIDWDTGKKSLEFIEDLVENKVIEYGDRVYDHPPHISKSVVPNLLKHVWEVVCRKTDRWLRHRDFLDIYEKSTMQMVSRNEYRELRRASKNSTNPTNLLGFNPQNSYSLFQPRIYAILEDFNPPNLEHFAERLGIVNNLKELLNNSGILVISGSTKMGKSILSFQIGASTKGNWRRIDFAGCEPEQIKERLIQAAALLEHNLERVDCILDDLNFDKQTHIYENALAKFIFLLKIRKGRIVITSHHKLPASIEGLFDIKKEATFVVPQFDENEIKELLSKYDCPPGFRLRYWTKIILLKTQAHPLLCHAFVRRNAENNWKPLSEQELIFNKNIDDIKYEFRKNLSEQLSETARELLYRLTIFIGRFKRKQALDMGRHEPALRFSGEEFDRLIGPWVEPVGNDYFRLSPLLRGIAEAHFTEKENKELNKTAAESFLNKTIGIVELTGLLHHGLYSEAHEALIAAVICLQSVDETSLKWIYHNIEWFAFLSVDNESKLYPKNSFLNYMLRRLQFKILEETKPERAIEVAEITEREINSWGPDKAGISTKQISHFLFLGDVLLATDVPFAIRHVFDWILQIIEIIGNKESFFQSHPEHQREFERRSEGILNPNFYIYPLAIRCKRGAEVVEFIEIMDESELSADSPIWLLLKTDNYFVGTLIDSIWLGEIDSKSPEWDKCLFELDKVVRFALKNRADVVGMSAYLAKSIIYQEYLKNPELASNALDESESKFKDSTLFIEDYRAKTFYLQNKYQEAFDIWQRVLPQIANDQNSTRANTFREAEICASKLNKWNEAAEFALLGEKAFRLLDDSSDRNSRTARGTIKALGYRADYAFDIWKAGNKKDAVVEFFNILNAFKKLPNPKDEIKINLLYKRIGHTIGWMNTVTSPKPNEDNLKNLFEPPPACFSNPEITERIRTEIDSLPILPVVGLKYLLSLLEYRLKIGNAIFNSFEIEVINSNFNGVNVGYLDLKIKHDLRNLSLEELIPLFIKYSEALADLAISLNSPTATWKEEEILKIITFAALIVAVKEEKRHLLPLTKWREDATKFLKNSAFLIIWFDFVEEGINLSVIDLIYNLKNPQELIEKRIIAALMLSSVKTLDVDTHFYANVLLITSTFMQNWEEEVEDYIERLVVDVWINICSLQRFSLSNPRITANRILSACRDESLRGISKAAKILMEANNAVSIPLDKGLLACLQNLINKSL